MVFCGLRRKGISDAIEGGLILIVLFFLEGAGSGVFGMAGGTGSWMGNSPGIFAPFTGIIHGSYFSLRYDRFILGRKFYLYIAFHYWITIYFQLF